MSATKTRTVQPRAGAIVAAEPDSDRFYILRRRATGRWELPGGRVDAGESRRDAAGREASEELGVPVLATARVAKLTFRRSGKTIPYSAFTAVAFGTPRAAESGFDAIRTVRWEDLASLPLAASLEAVAAAALASV